jgi:hypothetical protein
MELTSFNKSLSKWKVKCSNCGSNKIVWINIIDYSNIKDSKILNKKYINDFYYRLKSVK